MRYQVLQKKNLYKNNTRIRQNIRNSYFNILINNLSISRPKKNPINNKYSGDLLLQKCRCKQSYLSLHTPELHIHMSPSLVQTHGSYLPLDHLQQGQNQRAQQHNPAIKKYFKMKEKGMKVAEGLQKLITYRIQQNVRCFKITIYHWPFCFLMKKSQALGSTKCNFHSYGPWQRQGPCTRMHFNER